MSTTLPAIRYWSVTAVILTTVQAAINAASLTDASFRV